jgi:hypothetical protein
LSLRVFPGIFVAPSLSSFWFAIPTTPAMRSFTRDDLEPLRYYFEFDALLM